MNRSLMSPAGFANCFSGTGELVLHLLAANLSILTMRDISGKLRLTLAVVRSHYCSGGTFFH